MKKLLITALLGLIVSVSATTAWSAEVLVSAAASLTDVLKEIGRVYQVSGRDKLRFNFGSSSELARQIEEGAPADIFFSADLAKMDLLDKKGRIDTGSRRNLLANQLVLVVPTDSKLAVGSPKDLLRAAVARIALAQPEAVPAGVYAKKYLESEGLWGGLAAKIVPVLDVRATLAAVESGNVDAGFIYKTDAAISRKVKVVYEVPMDKGPKIIYPVALVKDSRVKEAARDVLQFLQGKAAKMIFEKYGFVVLV
jgi:molybdate transport system substrate-binding protein